MNGIFPFYKKIGPTSHDVIDTLRKMTGTQKIGHAGTLDPLAEGILVIAIGRNYTKKINKYALKEKEYIGKIKLGENSITGDAEGPIKFISSKKPNLMKIRRELKNIKNKKTQRPHKFSAIKINGKKSYILSRKGHSFSMPERMVNIKKISIIKYKYPFISLKIITGPGVYIRSIAEDLGRGLGTGAYLYSLKRTRVGCFTEKESLSLI
jgi:tRNA pseudouridine55 synthase